MNIDRINKAKETYNNLPPEHQLKIEQDFMEQFIYHSNALEGNSMSLKEVGDLLKDE